MVCIQMYEEGVGTRQVDFRFEQTSLGLPKTVVPAMSSQYSSDGRRVGPGWGGGERG